MSKIDTIKKAIKNPKETKKLLEWMISIVWPYKSTLFITFSISLLSIIISYVSTVVGKYVIDDATQGVLSFRNMSIMVITIIISILIGIGSKILGDYISEQFSFKLRVKMYDDIQRSVWKKIQSYHSGDLVTRLTSDISTLSNGLITFIPNLILISFQLMIALGILFYYDPTMAFFAIVIGPVGAVCNLFFRRKYTKLQMELRENESEYRSFMQESLIHLTVMKAFQQEDDNYNRLENYRNNRLSLVYHSSKLMAVMSALMRIVYNVGYVVTFCWGAYQISTGAITYGTMTIFISLVSRVQGSVSSMASMVVTLYSMMISGKRIYDVTQIEKEEYQYLTDMPTKVGVKVDNVSFSYGRDIVLDKISFTIQPGEKIGIIGESGIGKTTLIRNLLALVLPDSGSITYFDENGKEEALSVDARRFISYVPQGNTLISGTIADNLRIGKENATEEEMWKALEISGAKKFMDKLPDGLQTVLSEKSGGISEGQAQRISIARALISDKPVLILDEATSALDENTEELILSNLQQYYTNRTCFIITHRKSMLRYCEKVLELEEGNVTLKSLSGTSDTHLSNKEALCD